jgi:hypothetical protein
LLNERPKSGCQGCGAESSLDLARSALQELLEPLDRRTLPERPRSRHVIARSVRGPTRSGPRPARRFARASPRLPSSRSPGTIVGNFELLGFSAQPVCHAGDLLSATTTFDCFALDRVVGETTVLDLVLSLRAADASCPIVILTAQVATCEIDETGTADAMNRYDLLFCGKPVRASILAAMLSRAFATRPDRRRRRDATLVLATGVTRRFDLCLRGPAP